MVDAIFHRQVSEVLTARAAAIWRDYVEAFGLDLAARKWNEIPPERKGRGAPKVPHDPQRDKTLLLLYRYFEAKHPTKGVSGCASSAPSI